MSILLTMPKTNTSTTQDFEVFVKQVNTNICMHLFYIITWPLTSNHCASV